MVSEPHLRQGDWRQIDPETTAQGKTRTDEMRIIATGAAKRLNAAATRERAALSTANQSRRTTGTLLRRWLGQPDLDSCARHANAASRLERRSTRPDKQLREPLPRRDELGAVGARLTKVGALLVEKDASLRATLAEREQTLTELRVANGNLAARDADSRAYAEFVRELKSLDVQAFPLWPVARAGSWLAEGDIGVAYLLDGADRIVPIRAIATDGRALDHHLLGAEGLPRAVMERREPMVLGERDFGRRRRRSTWGYCLPLKWLLAQLVAVGDVYRRGWSSSPGASPSRGSARRYRARRPSAGLRAPQRLARSAPREERDARRGESLSRANRVKTEFLVGVDVEPGRRSSAILGFADPLLQTFSQGEPERAGASRSRLSSGMASTSSSLINDILDLAKAAAVVAGHEASAPVADLQLAPGRVAEVESLRASNDV